MKKTLLSLATVLATLLVFSSCSSPKKMKDNANRVTVQCEPQVLEIRNGEIVAKWTANFPAGYFHKKGILRLQPVLVYQGGEVPFTAKMLQGTAVNDNYEVIPVEGGKTTQAVKFDYKPGMEKSRLELRATLIHKNKEYPFDQPYRLADGAIATSMLVNNGGHPAFAADAFQPFVNKTKEGEIKYVVNRSDVRKSELSKTEIIELKKFIEESVKDPKQTYEGLDVSSYASPEGRFFVNERLSIERGKTSQVALHDLMKKDKKDVQGMVTARHTAEDWEGFKELVSKSNMQDKDLILRVLSMYSDPETREREIRNMSKAFRILEEKILPELRRSVMTAKVRVNNYSDDELKGFVNSSNVGHLDVESLLRAATLYNDNDTKIRLYRAAAEKYSDDRAYNNLAAAYLANGDLNNAKLAFNSVKNKNTPEARNNQGVIALKEGKIDEAAQLFASAGSLAAAKQNTGVVAINKGVYETAATSLAGTNSYNEALALVLTGKLDQADKILSNLTDAKSSYLRAVIASRKGNENGVSTNLAAAFAKDPSLKARAQNDIEFARFPNLVK